MRHNSGTIYHPTGTCRMGEDDRAVVDTQLRVNGVGNLRIADGSIMPTVVSGNTNAGCIMIGERCADFLVRNSSANHHGIREYLRSAPVREAIRELAAPGSPAG